MFSHKAYLKLGAFDGADFQSLTRTGYELVDCSFSFQQGVDKKGQPFTKVSGGMFSLVIPTLPTPEITQWAMKSTEYKIGAIIILDHENVPQEKVLFENAACINMTFSYTQSGKGYATTTIVIQAEDIRFGKRLDFFNEWTK